MHCKVIPLIPGFKPVNTYIFYSIRAASNFETENKPPQNPALAQCYSLEMEAAGVQFPHADNRAEPVSSSLLSKLSYSSDRFLGKISITAASLLYVICFLDLILDLDQENAWKWVYHLEYYEIYLRGKLKERRGKGREWMKSSEFVCMTTHQSRTELYC